MLLLFVLVAAGVHYADGALDPHITAEPTAAKAPYQVPIPASAPTWSLLPGQVLIPAQVLAPGQIVIPSQGTAYVAGSQPGQVFNQSYTGVKIANIGGSPQSTIHRGSVKTRTVYRERTVYVRAPNTVPVDQYGLTRGEEGAVLGGVVGAGTGALVDSNDRLRGAGVGGLIGAVGGGVVGHAIQPR